MKNLVSFLMSFMLGISPAFAWTQASSKVVQVDQASGVSSTPNYWKTGDAEALFTGVAAYNDGASTKPVDCTGGSSTMTGVRSTTNPMYDKFSWLVSKPASNVQGQGIAFEFDVDNGIAAVEMMDLMFEYIVGSGTFAAGSDTTNSDLMVYLYDVTAGQLIEPTGGSKLYTSSTTLKGDYRGWFQSTLGSKKYRVCLHQATNSPSAYTLKVDAGKVQKSKIPAQVNVRPSVGTIMQFGGSTAPAGFLFANGAAVSRTTYAKLFAAIGTTYGAGDGSTTFNLPNFSGIGARGVGSQTYGGETYTATLGQKRNDAFEAHNHTDGLRHSIADPNVFAYGNVAASGAGVGGYSAQSANLKQSISSNAGSGTETHGPDLAVNFIICYDDGGARMSDGYEGRVVSFISTQSSAVANIPNGVGAGTQIPVQGVLKAVGIEAVSGIPTVRTAGDYNVNGFIELPSRAWGNTGNNINIFIVHRRGSTIVRSYFAGSKIIETPYTSYAPISFSGKVLDAQAGDTISLSVVNWTNAAFSLAAGTPLSLYITKDSGTPFMSPTALWETHYAGTAGDAIGTTDSLIKFTTKVEDTFGSYNPATGLWTAKGPATCSFGWRVSSPGVNLSTTQNFIAILYKNSSGYRAGSGVFGNGSSVAHSSIGSLISEKVNTGDTFAVYANSGVATTSGTTVAGNYFTVSCRQ